MVLFAHPALERARVAPVMVRAAEALPFVSLRDLYALYPDTTIDIADEQQALARHDLIVLQFPMHWYSVPSLLKEWLDLVLTHGWAYGQNGKALSGKSFACAFSAAGTAEAYSPEGQNRFTLMEFLRPLEQTASLCRMRWLTPFAVLGAADLDAAGLVAAGERYAAWLTKQSAKALIR